MDQIAEPGQGQPSQVNFLLSLLVRDALTMRLHVDFLHTSSDIISLGHIFLLETDHKPLEWLESTKASKSNSQRLERWSLELRAFDFSIMHRPGPNYGQALFLCCGIVTFSFTESATGIFNNSTLFGGQDYLLKKNH